MALRNEYRCMEIWADARAVRPYMLIAFSDAKASEMRGNMGTQPTNRMAVSLFILSLSSAFPIRI